MEGTGSGQALPGKPSLSLRIVTVGGRGQAGGPGRQGGHPGASPRTDAHPRQRRGSCSPLITKGTCRPLLPVEKSWAGSRPGVGRWEGGSQSGDNTEFLGGRGQSPEPERPRSFSRWGREGRSAARRPEVRPRTGVRGGRGAAGSPWEWGRGLVAGRGVCNPVAAGNRGREELDQDQLGGLPYI